MYLKFSLHQFIKPRLTHRPKDYSNTCKFIPGIIQYMYLKFQGNNYMVLTWFQLVTFQLKVKLSNHSTLPVRNETRLMTVSTHRSYLFIYKNSFYKTVPCLVIEVIGEELWNLWGADTDVGV